MGTKGLARFSRKKRRELIYGDDAQWRIVLYVYKHGRFAKGSACIVDSDRVKFRVWITAHLLTSVP